MESPFKRRETVRGVRVALNDEDKIIAAAAEIRAEAEGGVPAETDGFSLRGLFANVKSHFDDRRQPPSTGDM